MKKLKPGLVGEHSEQSEPQSTRSVKRYLDLKEAAIYLNVSQSYFIELVKAGYVPYIELPSLGKRKIRRPFRRYDREDLDEFTANLKSRQASRETVIENLMVEV